MQKNLTVSTGDDMPDIHFEISADKMLQLLSEGQICATDLSCKNANSKKYLQNLCLLSCMTDPGVKADYPLLILNRKQKLQADITTGQLYRKIISLVHSIRNSMALVCPATARLP